MIIGIIPSPEKTLMASEAINSPTQQFWENWRRVNTWSGEITIEDTQSVGFGNDGYWKGRVRFVLDRRNRQVKWNWTTTTEGSRTQPPSKTGTTGLDRMIKHGATYRSPVRPDSGPHEHHPMARILLIDDLRPAENPYLLEEFDLLFFLTAGLVKMDSGLGRTDAPIPNREATEWERISPAAQSSEQFVARDGDLTVTATLENSQAGNLVSLERRSNSQIENWQYRYQTDQLIWLPSEIIIQINDRQEKLLFRRILRVVQSAINQKIDRAEFSLDRLGARSGDLVRDQRTGSQYVYQDPEPHHGSILPSKNNDEERFLLYLVLNAAIWLVILLIWAQFQRGR